MVTRDSFSLQCQSKFAGPQQKSSENLHTRAMEITHQGSSGPFLTFLHQSLLPQEAFVCYFLVIFDFLPR